MNIATLMDMKMVADTVIRDKIILTKDIGLLHFDSGYTQNLIACLQHPTHCIKWVLHGEEYYQLYNTTHRERTYIYVAELGKNISLENTQINRIRLNQYYIPRCGFIYNCNEYPKLTELINTTPNHQGVFNLRQHKNINPLNTFYHMVNFEINKPLYLNLIEKTHITQHKH
jgi:hypothetical protein